MTDFPVPEGPTMQSTSPFSTENVTPFNTGIPLNFLTTSRNSISLLNPSAFQPLDPLTLHPSSSPIEHPCYHVAEHEDEKEVHDDALLRGATDAGRTELRPKALGDGDGTYEHSEDTRLKEPDK